jgi:hypothetical protein
MNYAPIALALLLLATTACGDGATDTTEQSSEWWEEDGSTTGANDDTQAETDDRPDDGDKPEDADGDKPDSEEGEAWSAMIDTESGTGTFTYENNSASGENCLLTYPVLEAVALDTCASCSFAWDLQLGDVEIALDEGGCGEFAIIGNHSLNYGQGSTSLGEYEGTTYYDLYYSEDGELWENSGGYSSTTGTSWSFGTK